MILILIIVYIILQCGNKYKKGGHEHTLHGHTLHEDKMYYSICNHDYGLRYEKLEEILKRHNFIKLSADNPVHVSFGSSEKVTIQNGKKTYHDPLFITQPAGIKNTLGGQRQIIEKSMLFKTIKQLIPNGEKYLPKTYTINEFELTLVEQSLAEHSIVEHSLAEATPKKSIAYILKKNKTSKQQGVKVFFDKNGYYKAKKDLEIIDLKGRHGQNAIISEYILNPKTIEGKKFNIRLFVILSIESGIKRCYIHDEVTITTALQQYIPDDWENPEIHISGGKYTEKYYKWPQDVYGDELPSDAKHNFAKFKKTLAMGIALTDMSIYNEFFIGYKVFGVDAMVTENNHFFILEVNNCIGFGCAGFGIKDKIECDQFENRFSEDYFSFILDSVVFPPLGITRRPIALAEVITIGTLSPFSGVLIGSNQCLLVPISDASPHEIDEAKKIHFYHLSFDSLLDHYTDSKKCNIFLIKNRKSIIGYIGVGHLSGDKSNNLLTIAIDAQYQNRGIATAMIAQILEIYSVRNFVPINNDSGKLYMKKPPVSIFIDKIAHRLNFILKNNIYERPYKIKNTTLDKIIQNKLLTCNVNINDGTISDVLLTLIYPYMVNTISQFVHLSFTTIDREHYKMTHASTGSKFGHHYITQGAELKSSLNIKILYGATLKEYIGHDYFVTKDKIYSDDIIGVNIDFVLYMRNGLKMCYVMDSHSYDKMSPNGEYTNISEKSISKHIMIKIKEFTQEIAQLIIKNDFSIYKESNAGFNVFRIYAKVNDNELKIQLCNPSILLINYTNQSKANYDQYIKQFSNKYYQWLCYCVIYPHFGLLKHNQYIPPIAMELINTNQKLQATILTELVLEFNEKRDIIQIYLSNKKIGVIHTKLHSTAIDLPYIFMDNIELDIQYRKKNIAINVLFLFMDILGAYYAPSPILLLTKYCKQMHNIAFELEFAKMGDIYMRKCRN
jgi:hypothetical protein